MKEYHFNISRFAKVMQFETYAIMDELCRQNQTLPTKISLADYIPGKGSNLLTTLVMKLIKWTGGHAERVNTTGIRRKIKGKYIWTHSGSTKGSADIHAVIEGRFLALEIKFGKDKQSEAQKRYQDSINKSGGQYHLIRSVEDAISLTRSPGMCSVRDDPG